ncbi:unnamed protein product [Prorocentrum cordatum]|uniref:Uncharacterized protein n=1 Tax=Prorocentrum cordatum TaxID=2364126 RepID=A0ABN9UI67_9DINO|nr:unnamed protein product [Polarella glacialis]
MDSSSTSREREAGDREERGRVKSSRERGRKASERGSSRAEREESTASGAQQEGGRRPGNDGKLYNQARFTCPAREHNGILRRPQPKRCGQIPQIRTELGETILHAT